MKIKRNCRISGRAFNFKPAPVARFGAARLVKHFDGPYELIGGTSADQDAARDWCSLFAPEVVFFRESRQNSLLTFSPRRWH